ncbi:MAG: hypothetical protein JKX91_10235 [Rhizobiaceae bacterium]|nr:hypothetical protein [Rhizobiaceae bacterium]
MVNTTSKAASVPAARKLAKPDNQNAAQPVKTTTPRVQGNVVIADEEWSEF